MNRSARLFVLALSAALSACVIVPTTVTRYDPECRIIVREMTLHPVQIATIGGCSNEGCATLLVAAGATAAASTVISGSIAIIGNVVYWLEEHGRCVRSGPIVSPPLPPDAFAHPLYPPYPR